MIPTDWSSLLVDRLKRWDNSPKKRDTVSAWLERLLVHPKDLSVWKEAARHHRDLGAVVIL